MTNGAGGQTVSSVDGPVVTVKYKEGEKKIIVGPTVPIVRYEVRSFAMKSATRASSSRAPPSTLRPRPRSRMELLPLLVSMSAATGSCRKSRRVAPPAAPSNSARCGGDPCGRLRSMHRMFLIPANSIDPKRARCPQPAATRSPQKGRRRRSPIPSDWSKRKSRMTAELGAFR
jgi:hypothetical protein